MFSVEFAWRRRTFRPHRTRERRLITAVSYISCPDIYSCVCANSRAQSKCTVTVPPKNGMPALGMH